MQNNRTDQIEHCAEVMKALSNPNRLKLFLRLADCCTPGTTHKHSSEAEAHKCVGEVSGDLGLAPSTVSHHLKELRHAGLITSERRGQMIECSISRKAIEELADFFKGLL